MSPFSPEVSREGRSQLLIEFFDEERLFRVPLDEAHRFVQENGISSAEVQSALVSVARRELSGVPFMISVVRVHEILKYFHIDVAAVHRDVLLPFLKNNPKNSFGIFVGTAEVFEDFEVLLDPEVLPRIQRSLINEVGEYRDVLDLAKQLEKLGSLRSRVVTDGVRNAEHRNKKMGAYVADWVQKRSSIEEGMFIVEQFCFPPDVQGRVFRPLFIDKISQCLREGDEGVFADIDRIHLSSEEIRSTPHLLNEIVVSISMGTQRNSELCDRFLAALGISRDEYERILDVD